MRQAETERGWVYKKQLQHTSLYTSHLGLEFDSIFKNLETALNEIHVRSNTLSNLFSFHFSKLQITPFLRTKTPALGDRLLT